MLTDFGSVVKLVSAFLTSFSCMFEARLLLSSALGQLRCSSLCSLFIYLLCSLKNSKTIGYVGLYRLHAIVAIQHNFNKSVEFVDEIFIVPFCDVIDALLPSMGTH